MKSTLFPNLDPAQVLSIPRQAADEEALVRAREIIASVRKEGREALLDFGRRFDDLGTGGKLVYSAEDLEKARRHLPAGQCSLLERTAERIAHFARAQRQALADVDLSVQGGRAGVRYFPVNRAGCYSPGGRFPLPSSVLMTTVTAATAGVPEIWVASPKPCDLTLAAAAIGGASSLVAIGGAQAIAALATGVEGIPSCDVIVGPGNRYVTAAKQLVSGQVGIDMLAGPSELVILADSSADPGMVAADLLAQAEHDPDALPFLITTAPDLGAAVQNQLYLQLAVLPTGETARLALANGGTILVPDMDQAIGICDRLAPEHLEILCQNPEQVAARLKNYGAIFIGSSSAEVLGDYGAGPNHVLPTGTTARFSGALSVLDFLVPRTWLHMGAGPEAQAMVEDAVSLARLEGLEGHARSAAWRRA